MPERERESERGWVIEEVRGVTEWVMMVYYVKREVYR